MLEDTEGFTVWFTGLPSSGKSTLAHKLNSFLKLNSIKVELLDGDVVRTHLSKGLGFSKEDREINIKRIGFVCHLLVKNGVSAIAAVVSPYRETRDYNRRLIGRYIEVYVKTSLATCETRDVKGLYKKARSGEIQNFTGINDIYEEPLNAEVVVDTDKENEKECLIKIIQKLSLFGYLDKRIAEERLALLG